MCVGACMTWTELQKGPAFLTLEALRLSDLFLPGSRWFITSRHQPLHLDCDCRCVCIHVCLWNDAPYATQVLPHSSVRFSAVNALSFPSPILFPHPSPFHKAALSNHTHSHTCIHTLSQSLSGAACCDVQCWVLLYLRSQQDLHTCAHSLKPTYTHTHTHTDPVTLNVFTAG